MIRTYIRYSYGGYKNFLVNCSKDELLSQVATIDNNYNLPDDAILLFNRGHAKILYTKLHNSEYSLLIKGIPSPHTDADGRQIPFEIQFIGSDKTRLDNLTIGIANDIKKFEGFLFDLFYERSGLYIKGDSLKEYIQNSINLKYTGDSELLDISKGSSKVSFFVPLSQNFNLKSRTTVCQETISRVLQDLQFEKNDFKEAIVISYNDLLDIQNRLEGNIISSDIIKPDIDNSEEQIVNTDTVLPNGEVDILKRELATERANNLSLKEENKRLSNRIKYLTYGLVGTSLVILLICILKK